MEISRGPNSSIFGLGNTGGGVNINAAKATLGRASTTFGTRFDSYGGYRANFDLNRNLLDQRFAFRLMGVYEEKGFVRALDPNRPVYDKARYYFDLMAGYDLRLWQDRVRARVQLNIRNLFEDGRLQPIAVNPDGSP